MKIKFTAEFELDNIGIISAHEDLKLLVDSIRRNRPKYDLIGGKVEFDVVKVETQTITINAQGKVTSI